MVTVVEVEAIQGSHFALIRHGETDWNKRGLIQGVTDVPLNETGLAQAMSAAERLMADHSHFAWSAVVTSALVRARVTGQVIADILDIPMLEPMTQFAERNYGTMEGVEITRARELHPTGEYPESEHNDQVFERSRAAIESLRETHPGGSLIIVSHGGLLHTLLSRLHGTRLPPIQNATVNVLEYSDDGWVVRVVNNDDLFTQGAPQ